MPNRTLNGAPTVTPNKKKIILIFVALIAFVVIIFLVSKIKITTKTDVKEEEKTPLVGVSGPIPDAAISTDNKELIDAKIPALEGAKVVAPGANPITPDNKVVTPTGQVATSSGRPMDPGTPRQTSFLDPATLPASLIKLNVGSGRFDPKEFSTTAGAPTSFSLTGTDNLTHLIAFDDASLGAIIILVGPGQTKAITFNAPEKTGDYTFHCEAPGHTEQGETGKMIVR